MRRTAPRSAWHLAEPTNAAGVSAPASAPAHAYGRAVAGGASGGRTIRDGAGGGVLWGIHVQPHHQRLQDDTDHPVPTAGALGLHPVRLSGGFGASASHGRSRCAAPGFPDPPAAGAKSITGLSAMAVR